MEINKTEQYVVYKPQTGVFDTTVSAQIEKSIAVLYSAEGRVNFIVDLSGVNSIEDSGIILFQKVQRICRKESGLLVLVVTDDQILEHISGQSEEFLLMLPSIEEAIDAVFMNELENDFKEGSDDEFESENDY
jgi:anti-anti-sigma regulatory factor